MIKPTILIVEDESEIVRFLKAALDEEGMNVITAGTLKEGMQGVDNRQPDMIILDLGLPDGDGRALIEKVRAYSMLPIIVLSARSDENSKIEAIDSGADDYLTKPFSVGELKARLRTQLRRHDLLDKKDENGGVVKIGELEINTDKRQITKAGEALHLTKIEFKLLLLLVKSRGKVLTQREILSEVWGPGYVERSHYCRIYMGHLRQKIETDPARPRYILTETGIGYRLAL